jgi:catalase
VSIKLNDLSILLLSSPLLIASTFSMASEKEATAVGVVSEFENNFGVHKGERRNHTKGTCATGEFIGMPEANVYTKVQLFTGNPIPVVARFSMPGGNPNVPDTAKIPRGLALEFRLPEGSLQHMTMLNTPVFGAATPQTFFEGLVAKNPNPKTGKPDPEKIKAFKASHPDTLPLERYLAKHNPPPSWANSSYFGIHTFKFINSKNMTTLVRWRFVPEDGEKYMTDSELKASPANFLEDKLIQRVKEGPVRWNMMLTIGGQDDPVDNPTLSWPANRKEIKVGTLSISSATPQKGAECEQINFDPLVMTSGIEPTNDPVLLFRRSAYAVSFGKRLSERQN